MIDVVAWGYHWDPYGPYNYDRGTELEKLLNANREKEVTAIQELTQNRSPPNWNPVLLTIINKADLWWDEYQEVLQFYERGPYHQALGRFRKRNYVMPSSCKYQRFADEVPIARTFDDDGILNQFMEASNAS